MRDFRDKMGHSKKSRGEDSRDFFDKAAGYNICIIKGLMRSQMGRKNAPVVGRFAGYSLGMGGRPSSARFLSRAAMASGSESNVPTLHRFPLYRK